MRSFIVFLSLLLALPALAENGRDCTEAERQEVGAGPLAEWWCVVFLDDVTAASGGPVTLDMGAVEARNGKTNAALPDHLALALIATDCSAGTVTFATSYAEGGIETDMATPNPSLEVAGGATDTTLLKFALSGGHGPIGSLLHARWIDVATCTTGYTVLAVGYRAER